MDAVRVLQQGVLFAHVVAFAVALSAVLHEDIAILKARRVDAERLATAARTLSVALLALWASGLALVVCDIGLDVQALLARPKLAAKLVVVTALTANGLALHALALPVLRRLPVDAGPGAGTPPMLPLILGAVSTASWLYASFIGVSRLIAPWMRLADFLLIYAALLAGAIAVALLVVRPRMAVASAATAASSASAATAARGSIQGT